MSTVAIVQARLGSVRFPKKVLLPITGTPVLGLLLDRLGRARSVDRVIVATSDEPANDALAEYAATLGLGVFRGSETDVLDRFYRAAQQVGASVIVRITGDCPLVDPALVDQVVEELARTGADYASNVEPPSFPDGLDVEAFTFAALERAWREAKAPGEREHVTPYLRKTGAFRRALCKNDTDLSALRWTLDEPADAEVLRRVFEHFAPRRDFGFREVLAFQRAHPEQFAANADLARNEGSALGTGQKLWKRAKAVIPGGNMLLSKRAEMFLPERWPAYFERAEGCRVWDLDGRQYIDMCLMGVGTNTLGYGHPEVDEAVMATVKRGNLSTLNCPEEVYLAERLVELHPWAQMVRLARTGGEANALAIRIARAAAGKSKVAFCGYHGWHDWYLAANLGSKDELGGHLLPGLDPRGVPEDLRGSVLPFNYDDLTTLERLVREHDVGVIKMEVSRSRAPKPDFLQGVRKLATERGIVLIFDECTSGFRQSFGGLHLLYGVEPDMAVFGKTLGNGYAITAVIGRREVMQAAQTTFISSTFWTERIGPSAALKTLEVMERTRSWEEITRIGDDIGKRWLALAARHGLQIELNGLPALIGFGFKSPQALAYKTLITQDLLEQGYLASTAVYTCLAHTPEIVNGYFAALEPVFAKIAECEQGRPIGDFLHGPVCHAGFKRLN